MSTRAVPPLWKVMGDFRGLAILAVLVNHAAFLTMVQSLAEGKGLVPRASGRIQPAPGLVAWIGIQELTRFAVPLFLFLAGHFAVRTRHTWKAVWSRSKKLLYPHISWSLVALAWGWTWIPEMRWDGWEFLRRLVTGEALLGYFFTPLILQLYVLSRWGVPWIKKAPNKVLLGALLLQLLAMGWNYLALLVDLRGGSLPRVPEWAFPRFCFYFALGAWVGVRTGFVKKILLERRKALFLLTFASAVLLLTESRMAYDLLVKQGRFPDLGIFFDALAPWKITTALWVTGALFCCLALGLRRLPGTFLFRRLGNRAFQVYLLHAPVLTALLKLIRSNGFPEIPPVLLFFLFFGGSLAGALAVDFLVRRWAPPLRLPFLGE